MNDQIQDPNLLRCAAKKTASVLSRHIILVSKAIVAITWFVLVTAGAMYGSAAIWAIIGEPLIVFTRTAIAALFAIPWYYYVIAAIPIAYFGYGLLWCIARELQEEDWKSETAENFALTFAHVTFFLAAIIAFALVAIARIFAALVSTIFAFAFAFVTPVLTDNSNYGKAPYFAARFIGAWWHYRKRIKAMGK